MEKIKRQSTISGISLTICKGTHDAKTKRVGHFLLSAALFFSLIGSLCSMLGLDCLPQALTVGMTFILAETIFLERKKALIIVSATLSGVLIVAIIVWHGITLDGFRLLINELFTASEMHQAYKYDMLKVTAPLDLQKNYMQLAFLITAAILAVISTLITASGKKDLLIPVIIAVIIAEIYFGVSPAPGWDIFMCYVFALSAVCGKRFNLRETLGQGIALFVMLLIIFGIVLAAWPNADKNLSEFSEHIRDIFDKQIEQPIALAAPKKDLAPPDKSKDVNLNVQNVANNPYTQANNKKFHVNYKQKFIGAEVGKGNPHIPAGLFGLIFLALILASVAVWFGYHEMKAKKRRDGFLMPDRSAAINCLFIYAMDWLAAYGLRVDRMFFPAYSDPLSTMISPEYAAEYGGAVNLWQEAVYSNHTMSEEQRTKMRKFMEQTKDAVWMKSALKIRLKIKLKYFL